MDKLKAILLGIAIFLPIFLVGCDPQSSEAARSIEIVSVKIEEWTNPKDGEKYLVALPTWRNAGKVAVRQAYFLAGLKGSSEPLGESEPKEPQFYGAIVEPGTTVSPQRVPEDGVVLGPKKELEDKYGRIDADRIEVAGIGSANDFVPSHKSDA